jgi:hypothetical protein
MATVTPEFAQEPTAFHASLDADAFPLVVGRTYRLRLYLGPFESSMFGRAEIGPLMTVWVATSETIRIGSLDEEVSVTTRPIFSDLVWIAEATRPVCLDRSSIVLNISVSPLVSGEPRLALAIFLRSTEPHQGPGELFHRCSLKFPTSP